MPTGPNTRLVFDRYFAIFFFFFFFVEVAMADFPFSSMNLRQG